MEEMTSEILMLASVVAAYVGIAKAYNIPSKHNHVLSLVIAAIFVLVPDKVQQVLMLISLVGLTASGAYHYTKKKDAEQ